MANNTPVVLITGASRGLGRGIAERAAEAACSVGINYSANRKAAEETAALCRKRAVSPDQQFLPLQADVGRSDQRTSLVEDCLKAFGRIDALVNNAGVGPERRVDLMEMSEESYTRVMNTNLAGAHFLTQRVAQYWLESKQKPLLPGGNAVIFVGSVSAEMASLNRGEYCISKAGLAMAAKLWAARLADEGIPVYEIRPGIMATEMTQSVKEKYEASFAGGLVPQKRWGTADDVGLAVKAILQGYFPFSTGSVMTIDGGLTIPRL
ncbi:MAG: 3-ketoacyl-ACP reductase [Bacteroidia bacterium]|nr:MAG: 3-ketoacyl-ACP reductase [Bacteroidia bacterium]